MGGRIKNVLVFRVEAKLKKLKYLIDRLFTVTNAKFKMVLTDISQKDINSRLLFMPNIKSAIDRTRRTQIQSKVNRIRKSKYKATVKQMSIYLESGKINEAKKFLPEFHSQLMKVAKTGAIDKKTASRKISRITKRIQKSKK